MTLLPAAFPAILCVVILSDGTVLLASLYRWYQLIQDDEFLTLKYSIRLNMSDDLLDPAFDFLHRDCFRVIDRGTAPDREMIGVEFHWLRIETFDEHPDDIEHFCGGGFTEAEMLG